MSFRKPDIDQIPEFYRPYIETLPDGQIPSLLEKGKTHMTHLLQTIEKENFNLAYQPGKWTLAQVIRHVIDAERVFLYRALTMSRRDSTPLPSFDENTWAASTLQNPRLLSPESLLKEYSLTRDLSISTFSLMTHEELFFRGKANNFKTCANDQAFFILGHEHHHLTVIDQRYLKI